MNQGFSEKKKMKMTKISESTNSTETLDSLIFSFLFFLLPHQIPDSDRALVNWFDMVRIRTNRYNGKISIIENISQGIRPNKYNEKIGIIKNIS